MGELNDEYLRARANEWLLVVEDKLPDSMSKAHRELARKLAYTIMDSWRTRAVSTQQPMVEFADIMDKEANKAQGVVVAIVELIMSVGDGTYQSSPITGEAAV
jgi:hypothetical protein